MSWIMAGVAAVGVLSSISGGQAQNARLQQQKKFNIQKHNNTKVLSDFAQFNNTQRSNEIITQLHAAEAEAQRDVTVQERKAIGEESIRRGEGLTAGTSVVRSIDDVIQKGAKAQAGVSGQSSEAQLNVRGQARQANTQEKMKVIDSYNNLLIDNAVLGAQKKSTFDLILGGFGAGASGAASGASIKGGLK